MKDYLLLFRHQQGTSPKPESQEEMAASMEQWKNWMGSMAQEGKFVGGQPLTMDGRHMATRSKITDAPFTEGKEVVNGYLLIKAADYNEAIELSKGCPIFENGGSVEVREIGKIEM